MPKFSCLTCNKIFTKKDSYNKHLNRKTPCDSSIESLSDISKKVEVLKIELDYVKNIVIPDKPARTMSQVIADRTNEDMIIAVIKRCHDIMYSEEAIVGEKAMHDLMRLLFLRLLEPLIDSGKIDIMDEKYYPERNTNEIKLLKWNTLIEKGKDIEQNNKNLKFVWKRLLCLYPQFKNIFKEDRCFNAKPKTLMLCVHELSKIKLENFSNLDYDVKGIIYEKFINNYMSGGGKELGQFFTNRNYIDAIKNLIEFPIRNDKKYKIFDPCMGTGGFLTFLKKIYRNNIDVYGNDIESDTYIFALMNSILNFEDNLSNLKNVNSLHELDPNEKFHLIMTNPPFGTKIKYDDVLNNFRAKYCQELRTEEKNDKKFNKLSLDKFKEIFPIKFNKGESLFLQLCMFKLKSRGKCAIVLPDGQMLFGGGQNKNLRKYLLDNFILEKILFAPSGAFEHTGIKTCVFFFRKPSSREREAKDEEPMTESVEFWNMNVECTEWASMGSLTYNEMKNNNFSFSFDKYAMLREMEQKVEQSEYEIKTLGDICKILPTTKHKTSMGNEIGNFRFYNSSQQKKLYLDSYEINENSIILGNGGEFNVHYDTKFTASKHVSVCQIKPNLNINYKYIYNYLLFNSEQINSLFSGTGIQWLNKESIKSIQIPIPPIDVQERIVNECEEIQKIIEHTQQEIKNIDRIIEKYNKYVVPNELKHPDTEIKTLGDICKFICKSKRSASFGTDSGMYRFYTSSEKIKKCNVADYDEELIIIGDGGVANVKLDNKFSCSDHNILCKSNDESIITNKYIYEYLNNNIQILQNKFTGAGIKNINRESVKSIHIPVPPIDIQKRIVEFYKNRNNEVNKYRKVQEKLEKNIEQNKFICSYLFK